MDEYGDREITPKSNKNPELQKGHEYVIKRTTYDPFYVMVLDVTDKCYRLRYENGNINWIEKDYYNSTYTFVEDITDFKIQHEIKTVMEQEFETCAYCNGTGQIPDDNVTGGKSTCPLCGGSGQALKSKTFKEIK